MGRVCLRDKEWECNSEKKQMIEKQEMNEWIFM